MRDSFWRGREFASLTDMRTAALAWSREVAGRRACRPLDGAAPAAVFAAVEAPALRPLPAAPFVLATWSAARVGPDIHAKVGGALYSLPWRFIGDRVDARSTPSMVQFFHHGQLIKTHPRKDRGRQTDLGDYPPERVGFHLRTPTRCRRRIAEIGPACVGVIDGLLAENALFRLRAAQGVLGLGDRHDPARLEAAHRGVEHDPSAQVACPGPPGHHRPRQPVPQPPPQQAPPPARCGHADHPRIPAPTLPRGRGVPRRIAASGAAGTPRRDGRSGHA